MLIVCPLLRIIKMFFQYYRISWAAAFLMAKMHKLEVNVYIFLSHLFRQLLLLCPKYTALKFM